MKDKLNELIDQVEMKENEISRLFTKLSEINFILEVLIKEYDASNTQSNELTSHMQGFNQIMAQLKAQNVRKLEKVELEHQELDIELEHENILINSKRNLLKEMTKEVKDLERQYEDEMMNVEYFKTVSRLL